MLLPRSSDGSCPGRRSGRTVLGPEVECGSPWLSPASPASRASPWRCDAGPTLRNPRDAVKVDAYGADVVERDVDASEHLEGGSGQRRAPSTDLTSPGMKVARPGVSVVELR